LGILPYSLSVDILIPVVWEHVSQSLFMIVKFVHIRMAIIRVFLRARV